MSVSSSRYGSCALEHVDPCTLCKPATAPTAQPESYVVTSTCTGCCTGASAFFLRYIIMSVNCLNPEMTIQ